MADTRPTPISFGRAVWLCLLLLLSPGQFARAEQEDNAARENFTGDSSGGVPSYMVVRRAFFVSLALVVASGVFGYLVGTIATSVIRATSQGIAWLQIIGACVLLWGTLFVRGWEIQTYSGVVLTERVNQWLYRFLYCGGTAVLVGSLAWQQCQA